jgi:hypothetical protein
MVSLGQRRYGRDEANLRVLAALEERSDADETNVVVPEDGILAVLARYFEGVLEYLERFPSGLQHEVLLFTVIRDVPSPFGEDFANGVDLELAVLAIKLFIISILIRWKVDGSLYLGPVCEDSGIFRYLLPFRGRCAWYLRVRYGSWSRTS